MINDYFESSGFHIILSWVISIIVIFLAVIEILASNPRRPKDMPRLLFYWILLSIIIFSPIRYIIFQILFALNYPFQSWVAAITTIPLILYVPLVFSMLWIIGVGLPLLLIFIFEILEKWVSKKIVMSIQAIFAPIASLVGTYLFFLLLPYAGLTVSWLKAEDIIKTSNGAVWAYYKNCCYFLPTEVPDYTWGIINYKHEGNYDTKFYDAFSSPDSERKIMYRNHIAHIYLSDKQEKRYIYYAFRDLYEKRKKE
jgi:hypothetical protein